MHSLSAIQEAVQARGGFQLDWVCEEAFADIPKLAPCIDRIIPVAIRRWRKSLFASSTRAQIKRFTQILQDREYDVVIDAQGLLKTAWITRLARCKNANRWGYDWDSAREPLASFAVKHKVNAPAGMHAFERLRVLFGAALGYEPKGEVPSLRIATSATPSRNDEPDPSLRGPRHPEPAQGGREGAVAIPREIFFFHATSRIEKSWPIEHWIVLGRMLVADGYQMLLPWGADQEREQAEKIAQGIGKQNAQVLPKRTIAELAKKLQHCAGAIGVDTGLMHLSVALGCPTVAVMSASHLPKFSADRFAPTWASHARVVRRALHDRQAILPDEVLSAWKELF